MASFRLHLVIFLLSLTLLAEIESNRLYYPRRRWPCHCQKGYTVDYRNRCRKIVYIDRNNEAYRRRRNNDARVGRGSNDHDLDYGDYRDMYNYNKPNERS